MNYIISPFYLIRYTSLAAAGGFLAGGVPGVLIGAVDILAATGKIASKVYRANSPMMRALGPHLANVCDALKNRSDHIPLQTVVPFLEVYVAFSLLETEIKQFFEKAVTADNLDAVLNYLVRLSVESNEQIASLSDHAFLDVAVAIPNYVNIFRKMAEDTLEFSSRKGIEADEAAELFGKAIKVLESGLTNIQLGNIVNRQEALNALMIGLKYGSKGDDELVSAATSLIKSGSKLSNAGRELLFNSIQRIDWKELLDGAEDASAMLTTLTSKQGPFGYLSGTDGMARAAAMMFSQIARAQELGLTVLAIEKKIDITDISGVPIASGRAGTRDIDLVLKTVDDTTGQAKYIELKGWGKTVRFQDGREIGATAWMSKQLGNTGSQIYKDIILFATKREDLKIEAFAGVQWYMNREGVDALGGVGKLTDDVLDGVARNKAYFSKVMGVGSVDEWDRFLINLSSAMSKSGDEFFKAID